MYSLSISVSWEDLGKIIVIACLRTLLSLMLGREIKEIEEKIEITEQQLNSNNHTEKNKSSVVLSSTSSNHNHQHEHEHSH
jgi:hypothetical protein